MRDLQIRGAGSLLGHSQHGHMEAVGYDLYLKLLGEAIKREKGEEVSDLDDTCLVDMQIQAHIPESYIGDLNQRRGNIQSMTDGVGVKVIDAKVPLSEMFGYIGDLRSKTQGRAMFTMEMDSYDEVPKSVSEEIIKAQRGE